jgi:hypothetical protein
MCRTKHREFSRIGVAQPGALHGAYVVHGGWPATLDRVHGWLQSIDASLRSLTWTGAAALFLVGNTLILFALNPVETLSFGGLWLAVIAVYPASWLGMSVYLVLNVAFGTVGHVGVEPLPRAWVRWPILRHIGTSTFHAQHHARRGTNFGFYTLVWDRLFRTLDPEYEATFATPLGPRSD